LETLYYPHDENCEGTMCYCASREKRKLKEKEGV
jgi:hypothetical protein